ncbi:hypothetical protein [Algoriphagus sp. NG3]|uniref:hypothetical protein n=1 Tax=Algoriphagus sp. NG3 TaxID=3097546 RepID=UPI002A817DB8|nr:hypothetical protein [Algoriphagus sp. NG3]WPR75771.1 hypothetical protein SLW71_00215 [Algoriphagus sp. NG3]
MNQKYHYFKSLLFKTRINKKALFIDLKSSYTFNEQKYIISKLPNTFDSLIFGKPLFKHESEFASKELQYFDSVEKEMNWLIHLFIRYSKEINEFLEKKNEFEINLLLGKYEKSKEILNQIKTISYSYWGLENRFLQTQYEDGLEYNFKLLSKSKDKEIKDPAFFYLINFFSNKVEEDISYFSYTNSLESTLNRGMSEDYRNYFNYRLNSINHDYNDIGSLLWATSNLSLIDKYLLYKDIVAEIISKDDIDGKKEYVENHINYLSKHINDPFLVKAESLISGLKIPDIKENNKELILIDLFTKGKYEKAIQLANEVLLERISYIAIEIDVKCHIHLSRTISDTKNKNSIISIIKSSLYTILLRDKNSNEAIVELLTITNSISNFEISKEIMSFISYHITKNEKIEKQKLSFLFSKTTYPEHHIVFNDHSTQKKYLKAISEKNNITADFFYDIINGRETIEKIKIPEYRRSFYLAKNYFENGEFKLCKIEIESVISQVDKITYLKEQFTKLLFFSLIELEELDNAINLYVNSYLSNPYIVSKIKAETFAKTIVKKRWKGINNSNINFPIFMYLTHDDIHAKYISYDLFMRTQNLTFPSELNNCEKIQLNKRIFFLKNIASQKIISRKAILFKNSTEVLNERISICQILSKIDNNYIDEYNKEISDITQRLTVQQRIKEIDESKIYIDEVGIIEKELTEVQKSFNRYKGISNLLKTTKINVTGIGYDSLYDLLIGKIDTETYKKSRRKTDIQFELFVQLFLELRDKFLFSNQYGLDYYLSQRIRHGTIINQLRKSFKTHNLVTSKSSKSEEYLTNTYWTNRLDLSPHPFNQFVERMNEFSRKIDNIISNLKNKCIQIKTEDIKTKQTGWFDYMYIPIWDESYLFTLYVKELQYATDFNEFIKPMFEVLWQMTERNLSTVREKMNKITKTELISELDLLEIDLKKILPNKSAPGLYRAIADCRTNIQADIDYAIRWFNRSKNDEIDFTVEDALNTSLQIVNNIISPNILYANIDINSSGSLIKGAYFTHFVDLIKIFLTNISDYYSKVEIENKKTTVTIYQIDNTLILEFSNSLKLDENIEDLRQIINKKQSTFTTNNKVIRGEGSTGFPKANNILKNVFRNNNQIKFDINTEKFVVKCEIMLNNLVV